MFSDERKELPNGRVKYIVCFPVGLSSKHKQIYCRKTLALATEKKLSREEMGSRTIRGKKVGAAFSHEIDFFDIEAVGKVSK